MEYPWARMAALMSEPREKRRASRRPAKGRAAGPEPPPGSSLENLQERIRELLSQGDQGVSAATKLFLELASHMEANPGALSLSVRSAHRLRAVARLLREEYASAWEIYPTKRPPKELSFPRWVLEKALIALHAGAGEAVYPELLLAWEQVSSRRLSQADRDLASRILEALGARSWARGDWRETVHWWSRAYALGRAEIAEPLSYAYYRIGAGLRDTEPWHAFRYWKAAATIGKGLRPGKTAALLCARMHLAEARACWEKGRIIQARRHWSRAVECAQDPLPAAHLGLAFAAALRGDWKSGQEHAEKALQGAPESREAIRLLAASLAMQGRFEAAAEWAQELAELSPGDVELEVSWSLLLLAAGEEPAKMCRHLAMLARDTAHPGAVEGALLAARACRRLSEVKDLLEMSTVAFQRNDPAAKTLLEAPPRAAAAALVEKSARQLFGAQLEREYALPNEPKDPAVEYRGPEMPGLRWWLAGGA